MTDKPRPSLALQVLPPLFLLWLASTTHGPTLYLAGGLFGLVGFVSILRVGFLLLHPDKPYSQLLRPVSALVISVLAMVHTQLSLSPARALASETALQVQRQCNIQRRCPMSVAGWQPRRDRYSSQINYGKWVVWPILYHSDGKRFEVRLYKALDVGEGWEGGVDD